MIKNISKYIKDNKTKVIFVCFIGIVTYFIKLFFYSVSIDNEVPVNLENANDFPWIATGRFGVVLFERILHYGGRFNPLISNVIMIIFFIISIILLSYLLDHISKKKNSNALLIVGGFSLTSSTIAEMMNFTLMNAEISIGLFLIILAVLSLYNFIYEGKRMYCIVAYIALTIAMGEYQAFYPLFIGIVTFMFAYKNIYTNNKIELKKQFFDGVKILMIFIAAYISCETITKILEEIFNLNQSGYLTNQITWGKIPVADSVRNIIEYVKTVVFAKNKVYFNYSYIIAILSFVYCSFKIIKEKKLNSIFIVFALGISLISPFLLNIITGNSVVLRSQFNLPFITAFYFILLFNMIDIRQLKYFFSVVCIVFVLTQIKCTTDLFYSDYNRFKEDTRLTQDLMTKIDLELKNVNREEIKVIYIGMRSPKSTSISVRGETMGYSFYEWDPATTYGSNLRIYGLSQTLGYKYIKPDEQDVIEARKLAEELGIYPNNNSLLVLNDRVIVRLS